MKSVCSECKNNMNNIFLERKIKELQKIFDDKEQNIVLDLRLKDFISTTLSEYKEELLSKIAECDVACPEADGFEGRYTFPACGECIICEANTLKNKIIKES